MRDNHLLSELYHRNDYLTLHAAIASVVRLLNCAGSVTVSFHFSLTTLELINCHSPNNDEADHDFLQEVVCA
jgi:hypothetical protein